MREATESLTESYLISNREIKKALGIKKNAGIRRRRGMMKTLQCFQNSDFYTDFHLLLFFTNLHLKWAGKQV